MKKLSPAFSCIFLFINLLFLTQIKTFGQTAPPILQWTFSAPSTLHPIANGEDWIYSIIQTSDGGYIAAGYTQISGNSFSGTLVPTMEKLDANGNLVWEKSFTPIAPVANEGNYFSSVIEVNDNSGNFYVASGNFHNSLYVAQVNTSGGLMNSFYSFNNLTGYSSIREITDPSNNNNGYILGGTDYANSKCVLVNLTNALVLNTSTFNSPLGYEDCTDLANDPAFSTDGNARVYYDASGNPQGFILAGHVKDPTENVFAVRTDLTGTVVWRNVYTSSQIGTIPTNTMYCNCSNSVTGNRGSDIEELSSTEILVNAQCNYSFVYHPTCFYQPFGENDGYLVYQDYVLKLDPVSGNLQKSVFVHQFDGIDFFTKIAVTPGGGYAVGSNVSYNLPSIPDNLLNGNPNLHLGANPIIFQYDVNDNLLWSQQYLANSETTVNGTTGVGVDCIFGFAPTSDGGFIMGGNNEVNDEDYWAIKVQPPTCNPSGTAVYQLSNPGAVNVIPNGTIINTNTFWSGNYFVQGYVDVQSGTLQIMPGANIQFANKTETGVEGKIVVEPGAKLDVEGTLTSMPSCVNEMWTGVELRGQKGFSPANSSQSQDATHMGVVNVGNTGTISNALLGVFTMKLNTDGTWDFGHTGGIITANGANFINNQEAIDMQGYIYPGHPGVNLSHFTDCNFQTTDYPLQPVGYQPVTHVCLNRVHGINFQGNNFHCDEIFPFVGPFVSKPSRGDGINSFDATYNVYNCSNVICINGCCSTPNTFTGLQYGINASSANMYGANISGGNTFNNNLYDIAMDYCPGSTIGKNHFNKVGFGREFVSGPYNIFVQSNPSFVISDNDFTAQPICPATASTVVNNCGSNSNIVVNNTYTGHNTSSANGLISGVQPQFANGPRFGTGLSVQCNTFSQPIPVADVFVPTTIPQSSIPDQGSNSSPAGNQFSQTCNNIFPQAWDILNDGALFDYYYFNNFSAPNQNPTGCTFGIGTPNGVLVGPSCPPTNNGNGWWTNLSYISAQARYFKNIVEVDNGILAAGNASSLYSIINTGTPGQIENALLAPGPYLSDGVLEAAINKNLPPGILVDIIVPNSPVDDAVMATLNSISLPRGIRNQINAAQTGTSARTLLNGDIAYANNQVGIYTNATVSFYLNDTIQGNVDSAIKAMSIYPTPLTNPQLAQLASLQMLKGDNASALGNINIIQASADPMYQNYCRLIPIIIRLMARPNNFYSLQNDAADKAILENIAMDTAILGYSQARSILQSVSRFKLQYTHTVVNPNSHTERIMSPGNNSTSDINNLNFKLYPNPANSQLNIEYAIDNNSIANLVVYDMLGNKVGSYELPASQGFTTENIANLSAGFYVFVINVNQTIVQRGKFVIVR